MSYFADRNIPIRPIEKASGLIVAVPAIANVQNRTPVLKKNGKRDDFRQSPPVFADCGGPKTSADNYGTFSTAKLQWDPSAAVCNLGVLGDATKSSAQANVRYTQLVPTVSSAMRQATECSSTGKWETDIEQYIKQHAEAK
ncbi:MAG: hypothetical protein ABJB74_19480 [Gemmatimonas sp.]